MMTIRALVLARLKAKMMALMRAMMLTMLTVMLLILLVMATMKKIDNGGSATAGGEEVHPHYPFFKGVLFSTSLNTIIDHVIDYHSKKLHAAPTARLAAG